jgi:tRNA A-37 threonylcarbamoyl transferase component Bud32
MTGDTQPTVVADGMIGRAIGNYVVRHLLGQGGMGSVYLAEHPTIGKRVALKVLHAEFAAQPEVVQRFFNEAKAVNDIQHPNIVDIVDFGTLPPVSPTDPPIVYFFMEYIDGTSLTELIRRDGPLPHARAMAIALQIAEALAASHRKGIIHRDLKSDNVMLVSRRDQDFVKLLDFGIAKVTSNPANSSRTRTGIVMGTPQYMSPEQCEGRSSIDHRTDIYALGIVLYQMLTGRVPFGGESFGEVLVQQMAIPPLAPSLLAPQISPHVEQVVLKALEKRAEHRYAWMDDMVAALHDPVAYVEAHGGTAGFLVSPVLRDPALVGSRAAIAMLHNTAGGRAASTTLGGSAAQRTAAPAARGSRARIFGIAAAVVAAVVVGVVVTARNDTPASPGSAAALAPAPSTGASPTGGPAGGSPASGSPMGATGGSPTGGSPTGGSPTGASSTGAAVAAASPAGAPLPNTASPNAASPNAASPNAAGTAPLALAGDPAAAPSMISIAIESTPPGARVFVGRESTARGATPYVLARAAGTPPTEVRLVLPGYRPVKRTVVYDRDHKVTVAFEKASSVPAATPPPEQQPARRPEHPAADRDDSDEPMNPFANKKPDAAKKDMP